MPRPLSVIAALTVVAAVALPVPTLAQAPIGTKIGTLTCDIAAGIGLIIGSKKSLSCMFTPAQPGPREVYTGSVTKFGLDLGITGGGEMIWAVYAPSNMQIGALAGFYGGASAEASIGAGVGANVLVGGSNRTVTLQPLSVQGQVGVNLAAGVAGIELHSAR